MRPAPVNFALDFQVKQRHPGWFNASAVTVLLPRSDTRVGQSANRRKRRASKIRSAA